MDNVDNNSPNMLDPEAVAFIDDSLFFFDRHQIVVCSRSKCTTKVLQREAIELLSRCRSFLRVEEHAFRYCKETLYRFVFDDDNIAILPRVLRLFLRFAVSQGVDLPVSRRSIAKARERIERFRQDGILMSGRDINNRVAEALKERSCHTCDLPKIRMIGIPTANRPDSLYRAIVSYAKNYKEFGRKASFVVVDGSTELEMRTRNLNALRMLKQQLDLEIHYSDPQDRKEYAKRLSKLTGLSKELMEFAILGKERYGCYGASRNAILFSSIGDPCVQVDDDTICRIVKSPNYTEELVFGKKIDLFDMWFFEDLGSALRATSESVQHDFLGLHEALLGKRTSDCMFDAVTNRRRIRLDQVDSGYLDRIFEASTKVRITFLGILGDSGGFSLAPRLLLGDSSFSRLEANSGLRRNLVTRNIHRVVPGYWVEPVSYCVTMNIGMDGRDTLPPFMPVLRGEDLIFGQILRICDRHAVTGHLPYSICHKPPTERHESFDVDKLSIYNLPIGDTCRILSTIISSFGQAGYLSNNLEERLVGVGKFLIEVSNLNSAEFQRGLVEICTKSYCEEINEINANFQRMMHRSKEWDIYVRNYVAAIERTLSTEDFHIPRDLPANSENALDDFKSLIKFFGELLMNWPHILHAAKELKAKEQGLTRLL